MLFFIHKQMSSIFETKKETLTRFAKVQFQIDSANRKGFYCSRPEISCRYFDVHFEDHKKRLPTFCLPSENGLVSKNQGKKVNAERKLTKAFRIL